MCVCAYMYIEKREKGVASSKINFSQLVSAIGRFQGNLI